ncbi:MAG: gliding motility-associated C-terminal domain-containing protein [Bacteroidetes bacterium]|nr:gliding motility-associated C-terminal domain-containing protein [Bacteroidota bacterium]
MKKFYIALVALIVCLGWVGEVHASHIMGADITYIYRGTNSAGQQQYTVVLNFYRDCCSSCLISGPSNQLTVTDSCNGTSIPYTMTVASNPNGTQVPTLCPGQQTTCDNFSSAYPGVMKYTDTVLITLPYNCSHWTVAWTDGARNSTISNLVSPASQNVYIQAVINNSINPSTGTPYTNSSVYFTRNPVPFACVNNSGVITYSNGAVDANGDSLVYTLVNPLNTANGPIAHTGSYTSTQPVTSSPPVAFDPNTGILSYRPTQSEVDVITFMVQEYHNGVLVGSTMRDVQLTIINCTLAPPPTASSPLNLVNADTSGSSIRACPGTPTSFDITVHDPNGRNITLTSDINAAPSSIPGATFTQVGTGPTVTAHIAWTPAPGDTGCHPFTINMATDDCPIPGSAVRAYSICVLTKVTVNPHSAIYCGTPIQLTATGGSNATWSPMAGLTFPRTIYTPLAAPSVTTKYTFTSDCGSDTSLIIFNPPFTMDAGPGGAICQNDGLQLNATVDNTYAPYQVVWTPSQGLTDPLTHAAVNNILNPVASPASTTTYTVHFIASTGCERTDTVTVRVNGYAPRIQAKANPTMLCPGQPTQLVAVATPECGLATTPCSGASNLVQVGTGNNTQTGTASTYPSPYGNYYKSARHQILIHASELYSQLGSGGQITSIALQVGNPGNGSTCNGFTIRMGCVDPSIDSLTGYVADNLLSTVYVANYTPVNNWNTHILQTPYNWDGQSNLVIDFCFINQTNANINPQMKYTTTSYRSIWCTYSNNGGQCGFTGAQQNAPVPYAYYFRRPNVRFNVCTTPLTTANLQWTPVTPHGPTPANRDTAIDYPDQLTTYTVTLYDTNGCNSSDYVTVYVDTTNRFSVSPDTFVCSSTPIQLHAVHTGTASSNALTYTWSAVGDSAPPSGVGLTYANPTVTPTGTALYICTISGGTLPCTITDSARVTMGNNIPVGKVVDSITCSGANDGRITINMNAGTSPYTYTWSPPATGNPSVLTNLTPGTYYLTVTDANHCAGYDTTTLVSPAPLTLRLDSVNENCYGDATGSVTATVSGGRRPYRYTWSIPGGNASSLTSLSAGLYRVTVTDTSGCTILGQANVTQPAQLASSATHTNLTGASTHDGSITTTTTGGTTPYTYTWTCPPGVSVGNVSSANNLDSGYYYIHICDAHNCCVWDTVHITGPPPINVVFTVVNNLCHGDSNGVVSAVATGGVLPYTYSWNTTPPTTSDTARNLPAGTYTLVVTDSNGIAVSNTVTVTQPVAIAIDIDSTSITCYGANNGSLDAIPSGGTPGYTVAWNAGSDPLSGLAPGMYTVTVTDANNCVAMDTAYLTEPPQLIVAIASTDSVKCYGDQNGIARLSTTGGRPPYSYAWTGSLSAADSATDLAAGPFSVVVTDASGCTAMVAGNIYQPLQILVTATTNPAHCLESNDGSATASVSNGTPPYSYIWNGTPGTDVNANLPAGRDTLLVVDINGCSTQQLFTIDTQYVLHISLTADSTSCFNGDDGTATVTVANGSGPYNYNWEPSGEINSTAAGLPAGLDTVYVTDAFGCPATGSVEVYEPSEVVVMPYFTNPLCHGDLNGTIWLTASGGHPPYYYTFNGLNYQMTDTASGLPANPTISDNYLLPVTDARGCVQPVAVHLTDPPGLTAALTVTSISCANDANGAMQIVPGGGTTPYTYTWSDGAAVADTHNSLGPGTYSVTLTDANGCIKVTTATLVAPPPISAYEMKADSTHCPGSSDGKIHFVVQGGTPAHTYAYEYSLDGTTWQTIPDFYDLPAGVYQLHARDSMLCEYDTTITIYQPDPITVAITPQDTSLVVGTSISLVPIISNQTTQGINSYAWSPALGLSCIDCPVPVATPFETTTYQLVVNYGKNCYANATSTITIEHGPEPYIPNAFTPNGDGNNDRFEVYGTKIKTVSMRVFNRWGEKVFDSMGNQWTGWDGTYMGVDQPTSVYVYQIEVTYLDGVKKSYDGSITLIR